MRPLQPRPTAIAEVFVGGCHLLELESHRSQDCIGSPELKRVVGLIADSIER